MIRRLFLLLSAAALGPADVEAQDSTRADSARRLQDVTVSARRSVGTVGGASAVTINPMDLRASPAPTLDQALREAPFVHVRLNSRGEMELSVRGSDSRQAAVLLDGVPISLGWDHRADPSLVPITGAERLVIVRGLGSLLNGPNTLGGTIEVNHDVSSLTAGTRLFGGAGVDEYGSIVGSLGGNQVWTGVGGGALSVRGGLSYRQRDGLALPGNVNDPTARDGLRTNSDLTETDGFASVRWANASGRSVGASFTAFDASKGVPPEEGVSDPRLWRYPYHRRNVVALSAGSGVFRTPLGYASLTVGAGWNAGKLKIETYDDRTYATVTGQELGDETTGTLRALLAQSLGVASLRLGWTHADVKYTETLGTASPVDYQQKLTSVGAELVTPIGDATNLAGGVVFDHAETPLTGGRLPIQKPFDKAGWRLGASHELNAQWGLHASISQRSRFPALRELYSGALNRFTPNPALKPETLLGVEGGVTMQHSTGTRRTTLEVTGFRHRLDDAVVRITLRNPTRYMRINRDRIQSYGAEFLGSMAFGVNPERAITVTADALIQRIQVIDRTDNDATHHAENNPELRGRVEVGAPLPLGLRGFTSLRYTGVQYCLNGDTGADDEMPAAATVDVGVQRTVAVRRGPFRWLRTLLSLDNAGNQAVYDQCGLPQPGRTLRLMMTLR